MLDVSLLLVSFALLIAIFTRGCFVLAKYGISAYVLPYVYPTVVSMFYLAGLIYYLLDPAPVAEGLNVPGAFYLLDKVALAGAVHCLVVLVPGWVLGRGSRAAVSVNVQDLRLAIRPYIGVLLFSAISILIIASISFGIDNLLFRRTYQVYHASMARQGLQGLGESLAAIGPALLGAVYFSSDRRSTKFVALGFLVLFILYFIGTTTRFVAVAPIAFVLCGFFLTRFTWVYLFAVTLTVGGSAVLLSIPIISRGMVTQGIIPALSSLTSWDAFSAAARVLPENLLSPIWLAAITLTQTGGIGSLQNTSFWISINPAPGFVAGWYDVAQDLRINSYMPYNTVGELLSYGLWYLIGYSILIGLISVVLRFIAQRRTSSFGVTVGFVLLFMASLLSLQYNVRPVTRQFYYAVIVLLAAGPMWSMFVRAKFHSRY